MKNSKITRNLLNRLVSVMASLALIFTFVNSMGVVAYAEGGEVQENPENTVVNYSVHVTDQYIADFEAGNTYSILTALPIEFDSSYDYYIITDTDENVAKISQILNGGTMPVTSIDGKNINVDASAIDTLLGEGFNKTSKDKGKALTVEFKIQVTNQFTYELQDIANGKANPGGNAYTIVTEEEYAALSELNTEFDYYIIAQNALEVSKIQNAITKNSDPMPTTSKSKNNVTVNGIQAHLGDGFNSKSNADGKTLDVKYQVYVTDQQALTFVPGNNIKVISFDDFDLLDADNLDSQYDFYIATNNVSAVETALAISTLKPETQLVEGDKIGSKDVVNVLLNDYFVKRDDNVRGEFVRDLQLPDSISTFDNADRYNDLVAQFQTTLGINSDVSVQKIKDADGNDLATAEDVTAIINAGTYKISAKIDGEIVSQIITVNKAQVNVVVDNQTITAGGTPPELTYTVTGDIARENVGITIGSGNNNGDAITATVTSIFRSQDNLLNVDINITNGILTVNSNAPATGGTTGTTTNTTPTTDEENIEDDEIPLADPQSEDLSNTNDEEIIEDETTPLIAPVTEEDDEVILEDTIPLAVPTTGNEFNYFIVVICLASLTMLSLTLKGKKSQSK